MGYFVVSLFLVVGLPCPALSPAREDQTTGGTGTPTKAKRPDHGDALKDQPRLEETRLRINLIIIIYNKRCATWDFGSCG